MSSIPRFVEYAAAFEKAYASGDWSLVAPCFHEDAVYDVGLPELVPQPLEGRDAILDGFDVITGGFDRRFASRAVVLLEGPREEDGAVWVRGRADYTSPIAPDLSFELEETARFEGGRIRRLEDRYTPGTVERLLAYAAAHGPGLGLAEAWIPAKR